MNYKGYKSYNEYQERPQNYNFITFFDKNG